MVFLGGCNSLGSKIINFFFPVVCLYLYTCFVLFFSCAFISCFFVCMSRIVSGKGVLDWVGLVGNGKLLFIRCCSLPFLQIFLQINCGMYCICI